jgi:hypothetical protein
MSCGLHVNYRYFCLALLEIEFYRKVFKKYSNTKFRENLSNEKRLVPCGQIDGRADVTKLIVAFRNYSKAPKNYDPPRHQATH